MSAMVNLEVPWINVMSKMDLVTSSTNDPASGRNGIRARKDISRYSLSPLIDICIANVIVSDILNRTPCCWYQLRVVAMRKQKGIQNSILSIEQSFNWSVNSIHTQDLTDTIQIEDHPLVSFLPLNLTEPDSIETVLSHIDYTMQYGEDEEPKEVGVQRNSSPL